MSSVEITSEFGDMQVVVLMPGERVQTAYGFMPHASPDGLKNVPRRDLAVMRAMLQDALDDVDDERHRRLREADPVFAHGFPVPQQFQPRPAG